MRGEKLQNYQAFHLSLLSSNECCVWLCVCWLVYVVCVARAGPVSVLCVWCVCVVCVCGVCVCDEVEWRGPVFSSATVRRVERESERRRESTRWRSMRERC